MKCPNCKSEHDHRIVWDHRDISVVVGNAIFGLLNIIVGIAVGLLPFPDIAPLRRKCRRCGQIFVGPRKERPNFDACPKCEYNLKGNVSGRCPECGWRLTRRYRAHRKRADR